MYLTSAQRVSASAVLFLGVACAVTSLGADEPTTKPSRIDVGGTVVSFEMVRVPAGKVTLKNADGGETTVEVKAFSIGRNEVTWDEYDVYTYRFDLPEKERATGADAAARPSRPYILMDRGFGHAGFPALSMTHRAAELYCAWLSKKTGKKFRLPTEAEWVYASRAGAPSDPAAEGMKKVAWVDENADGRTHHVGTRAPNAFGLYDTLGNVAEWVERPGAEPAVIGGCYLDAADTVGVTMKETYTPEWQANDPQIPKSVWWLANVTHVGFRVVCEE